jgi:spermidine synthase
VASEVAPEAGPAASERQAPADPATPPLYFSLLLGAALVGAAHLNAASLPWQYLERGHGLPRAAPALVGGAAAGLAALYIQRRRLGSYRSLSGALALTSVVAALPSFWVFHAFGHGSSLALPLLAGAALNGLALGSSAALAARALGPTAMRLGAFWRLVNPFRLLAFAILAGVGAALATGVGTLRAALALAMVFAALSIWTPALGFYLERRPVRQARALQLLALVLASAGGLGFLAAERLVPLSELHAYPNPVIYHTHTNRQRLSVTSGQDAFELRIDGKLKASTIDEARYFQALVHPALTMAPHRARTLLLGGGTGLAEREILRHGDVGSLTVVCVDRALADLARRLRWLSRRADHALDSPKVRIVEQEPIVWLSESDEPFDVAIVDLPDPEGYLEGKSYTRYFYEAVKRHLGAEGVVAVQAPSPLDAPESFATVVATMRAAGFDVHPYHAAVPTIGDWGFALGFAKKRSTSPDWASAQPFLTGAVADELGYLSKDTRPAGSARPSFLFDQPIVESYREERAHPGVH